ncbi:MAG: DNA alkylation repair protein [Flammeovirgaceae bacterium]
MNPYRQQILEAIRANAGAANQHTFLDRYLGNVDPKYAIDNPTLRKIAKEWMREHAHLSAGDFKKVITSLLKGESATEKMIAGMILDVSKPAHRKFKPSIFDQWLNHTKGWAQVDTLCTGSYTAEELPRQWTEWKKLLMKLVKSSSINKRRAALVFLCSPVRRHTDADLAHTAIDIVDQLKHEREILITKAVSWVLRSLVKHHKKLVNDYVKKNKSTLPAIAVRETIKVIETGKK